MPSKKGPTLASAPRKAAAKAAQCHSPKFLAGQRALLLSKMPGAVGLKHADTPVVGIGGDVGDRAAFLYSGAMEQAYTALSTANSAEYEAAVARIDAGRYGFCERCGKLIPQARLKIVPEARSHVICPK